MQNKNDEDKVTIVSPVCDLLREPFFRLKIIEGKDIYINKAKKRQNGDLYAKVTYGSSTIYKTQVLQKTAFPVWNKTFEIDRVSEAKLEQNPIIISVYDSDPLGTDEIISTLIMPVSYFIEKKLHDKPIDLWAQLTTADGHQEKDMNFNSSSVSLVEEAPFFNFENEIITGDESKMSNPDIQKIHISLEIYDEINLKYVKLVIVDTEEAKEKGSLFKFFVYTIKIIRNDGLEWVVKRRYSEMRDLKEKLEKEEIEMKVEFPAKDMLKYLSYFLSSQEESYRKQCEERKQKLEDFLNYLAKIPFIYNFEAFNNFFTA